MSLIDKVTINKDSNSIASFPWYSFPNIVSIDTDSINTVFNCVVSIYTVFSDLDLISTVSISISIVTTDIRLHWYSFERWHWRPWQGQTGWGLERRKKVARVTLWEASASCFPLFRLHFIRCIFLKLWFKTLSHAFKVSTGHAERGILLLLSTMQKHLVRCTNEIDSRYV